MERFGFATRLGFNVDTWILTPILTFNIMLNLHESLMKTECLQVVGKEERYSMPGQRQKKQKVT